MTGKAFVDYVRLKTRTNSGTFTDSELLAVANARKDTISLELMDSEEDTLITPMRTDLIVGLREYPFPTSILSRIKYVEAMLDGVNWVHLDEFDLNQYQRPTSETEITTRFSNNLHNAFYDINRKALWLYSGTIIAVTKGLKLWCNTYPADLDLSRIADSLTDLSVDPDSTHHGFPRELHEIWARGCIIDYKESREKPIPLTETELAYYKDLKELTFKLKHGNMDRVVTASVPSSSDRGNNGANY